MLTDFGLAGRKPPGIPIDPAGDASDRFGGHLHDRTAWVLEVAFIPTLGTVGLGIWPCLDCCLVGSFVWRSHAAS